VLIGRERFESWITAFRLGLSRFVGRLLSRPATAGPAGEGR
jgi:hypothetical protein